jgi:hypothetical protein
VSKITIIVASLMFTLTAYAQDPVPGVLNFQAWKEQQVLEAQNQTLRISARISQLKGAKPSAKDSKDIALPNGKVKKSEVDTVSGAERDLKRSQESLQMANNLTLEDYVTIYLPTLQGQPEALQSLSQKLSKEELAEIFKVLVGKAPTAADSKRQAAVAPSF